MSFQQYRKLTAQLDRAGAGAWAMLIAGCMLAAMTLLAPAWLTNIALHVQHQTLTKQHQNLNNHLENYTKFITSIRSSEPHLMTNLAWHELHLRPVGTRPLDNLAANNPHHYQHFENWIAPTPVPTPTHASADINTASPIDTGALANCRLFRLTHGQSKIGLFTVSGMLILAALLSSLLTSHKHNTI